MSEMVSNANSMQFQDVHYAHCRIQYVDNSVVVRLHSCQLAHPPLERHNTPHRELPPPQDYHPPMTPDKKFTLSTHKLLSVAKKSYLSTKSCFQMPKSTKKSIQYMYISLFLFKLRHSLC